MKRLVVLLAALSIASAAALLTGPGHTTAASYEASAWCAGSQSWTSVRRDLGVPIRVKARVASVYFARSSAGRPTFIDLGRSYPNRQRVTLVIWGRSRSNFPSAPERMFRRGQTVCAQGVPELYRGVVQLEINLWDSSGRLLSF